MEVNDHFMQVKQASKKLALLNDTERNAILGELADMTEARMEDLLLANALDLQRMDPADPRYDRLQLTESRLKNIAADLRNVASLPSPLGRVPLGAARYSVCTPTSVCSRLVYIL